MDDNENISNQIDDVNDNLKEILQFLGNEFTEVNKTLERLLTEVETNKKEIDTLRERIYNIKSSLNQLPTRKRFDKIIDNLEDKKAEVDEIPSDVVEWNQAYRWFAFIAFVISTCVTLFGVFLTSNF